MRSIESITIDMILMEMTKSESDSQFVGINIVESISSYCVYYNRSLSFLFQFFINIVSKQMGSTVFSSRISPQEDQEDLEWRFGSTEWYLGRFQ